MRAVGISFLLLIAATCSCAFVRSFHISVQTSKTATRKFSRTRQIARNNAAAITYSDVLEMPEPIWTPGSDKTLYNFGPASSFDTVLYTAARPGNTSDKRAKVTKGEVREWIRYVKSKGISVVLALLEEDEFEIYPEPGLLKMYEEAGITCHVTPLGEDGAFYKIMKIIEDAEESDKKVVTHCTGGVGRCGRVAASWLVYKYNLSPKKATANAIAQAFESGIVRLGDTKKLDAWIGPR